MTRMKTPPVDAPLHTKTVAEQKADFTAEGSPSPGNVAGSVPPVTKSSKDLAPTSDSQGHAQKGPKGPKDQRA